MTLPGMTCCLSYFTDHLRNPWQMLVEPFGSAELRLKITGIRLSLNDAVIFRAFLAKDRSCRFKSIPRGESSLVVINAEAQRCTHL